MPPNKVLNQTFHSGFLAPAEHFCPNKASCGTPVSLV